MGADSVRCGPWGRRLCVRCVSSGSGLGTAWPVALLPKKATCNACVPLRDVCVSLRADHVYCFVAAESVISWSLPPWLYMQPDLRHS